MLNKALRLLRVYHDLSVSEAAGRLGLSKSYVSEIENNKKKVSLDVLEKYASAFDVPMSSLLLFSEQMEKGGRGDRVQGFVADKALKFLDWVAMISEEREQTDHAQ